MIKKFSQLNEGKIKYNSSIVDKEDIKYLEEITSNLEDMILEINSTDNLDKKLELVDEYLEVSWELRNIMEDIHSTMRE